jgi:hypothetical protein
MICQLIRSWFLFRLDNNVVSVTFPITICLQKLDLLFSEPGKLIEVFKKNGFLCDNIGLVLIRICRNEE